MPFPDRDSAWKEQHPDEGLLHEWLEDQLDTDAAARVASHVSTCETCRASVAEAHGLIAASRRILSALDDVPAGVVPAASASIARVASERDLDLRVTTERDANVRDAKMRDASNHEPKPTLNASAATPNAGVTDISSAATARSAHANTFRWRRWGSIAAIVVIGVTGTYVLSERNGNVSVLNAVSDKTAADSTVQRSATSAGAAAALPSASQPAPKAPAQASSLAPASAQAAVPAPVSSPVVAQTPARDREPAEKSSPVSVQLNLSKKADALADKASVSGVLQAAPPVATNSTSDSLSQRLEMERRKRASAEAVSADAAARPRIDAVTTESHVLTRRAATLSAPTGMPAAPSANRPAFAATVPFDSLVLVREPCFGRCPAYELSIDGSGHVRYRSRHPDDNGRESNALLSADELTRLSEVINAARVDTLKSYMPNTTSCGMAATDMPTLHLSVFRGGRLFKLDQYVGCSAATKTVPTLMRDIDAIVGTQRWLPAGYKLN